MADGLACLVAPLVGSLSALLIEIWLQPAVSRPWQRSLAALALHFGIWGVFSASLLAVVQRPFFTAAIWLVGFLFLVLVSNAKYRALREPFIFQDFEYLVDALKHPRLYLPFLAPGHALLALLAFVSALWVGLASEEPLLATMSTGEVQWILALQTLIGVGLIWLGARHRLPVSFDPDTDLQHLGMLASLWRYGEEEVRDRPTVSRFRLPEAATVAVPRLAGHLVVVQSESFFDARRLSPAIRPQVLREYDALQAEARLSGQLTVAAWGANTVRSEFAFLTGLANESLGVHRFNPYRRLAKQGIVTLVTVLRRYGYRTVCVHPYAQSFYARAQVFPRLGFDEFIDIRQFADSERSGPYIGDLGVAEKVCTLLRNSGEQPLFVFVITMENHGPLHWEKVAAGEVERFYSTPPPPGCDELTIYLRHLANADRMAGQLRQTLADLPGANALCWYGDHVPIMPAVYHALSTPDGRSDYLLWRSDVTTGKGQRQDLAVHHLAVMLLQMIGLSAGEEFDDPLPSAATPVASTSDQT